MKKHLYYGSNKLTGKGKKIKEDKWVTQFNGLRPSNWQIKLAKLKEKLEYSEARRSEESEISES